MTSKKKITSKVKGITVSTCIKAGPSGYRFGEKTVEECQAECKGSMSEVMNFCISKCVSPNRDDIFGAA